MTMKCKLCGSQNIKITYDGKIRNGGLGKYTDTDVKMYQCLNCDMICHEDVVEDLKQYYESKEYRMSLEGSSEEDDFYSKHDGETLAKFQYTGTEIFRRKIVADIGCACGAFLDFVKGVTSSVIEHVSDPIEFMADVYNLLSYGGQAIIGTPTEAPNMRRLLGEIYEKKLLFSTQHLWVFSEKNLGQMAHKAGLKKNRDKILPEIRYG